MYTLFEQIICHRCVFASVSRTLASRVAPSRTATCPRASDHTCVQPNMTSRFADVSSFQLLYCGVLAIFH